MSILRIVASFMRDYRPATPALPLQATPALSTHLRSPKSGGKGPSIKYRPHHRDPVVGYAVPLRHQGGGGRRRGQEIEQHAHIGAVSKDLPYLDPFDNHWQRLPRLNEGVCRIEDADRTAK